LRHLAEFFLQPRPERDRLFKWHPLQITMDNVIITKELQVERKHFYIEFRENERGRFMRITEEAHGRRNTIIIPSTGLEEFMAMAGEVIQTADRVPAAHG
jgi:hypothetical protein